MCIMMLPWMYDTNKVFLCTEDADGRLTLITTSFCMHDVPMEALYVVPCAAKGSLTLPCLSAFRRCQWMPNNNNVFIYAGGSDGHSETSES